ncbi:MAG: hypothetical protein LBF38_05390 [Deltaproteobacteria bacterium]|nr:hypothetical protein [Deltaproteobacteria bacterium]
MRFKLLAVSLLTLFLPLGLYVVYRAYLIKEAPHEFVMLIFSGTLMILLGLTGLVGLFHGAVKVSAPSEDGEGELEREGQEQDGQAKASLPWGDREPGSANDWSEPDLEFDDYDGDCDLEHEKDSDDSG